MSVTKQRWQINVAKTVLARNAKTGSNDRPIVVRDYGTTEVDPYTMAHGVRFIGPAVLVHQANGVWIETDGPIELIDPKKGLAQE